MPILKAAVAELERAINKLGFAGGFIAGTINGEFLDQKKYWPVLECAEPHDAPIYMHPCFPLPSLLCAINTIGVDNVLFAVDWPNESNKVTVDFLKHLPVGKPDLEKIAYKNAERVLRLNRS